MYNKLSLLPFAHLNEQQVAEIKNLEKKLGGSEHPVYLMALRPPEAKN
ncbi:MAG: hypothetical protein Q8S19_04975 [Bacillota bacterium]|nr:hypothetical protein [Bacillota bacterium]